MLNSDTDRAVAVKSCEAMAVNTWMDKKESRD